LKFLDELHEELRSNAFWVGLVFGEKLCKIFFLAVILESQFSDLAKELEFALS